MPEERKASEVELELLLADSIVASTPIEDVRQLLRAGSGSMWGSQMSIRQQRFSVVTDTIANLNARIRELERLRDQVRKAQLSARRSRPKSLRKRTARAG
jgi:hypothetical protein